MIVSSSTKPPRFASRARAHSLACVVLLGIASGGCARPVGAPEAPAASPAPAPSPVPSPVPAPSPQGPPHDGPPPEPEHPISATERAAAIERLSRELEQSYVIPETATRIGQTLRQHLAHGDYAALATGERFARAVTDDLAAIAHDKHLEVRYFESPIPTGAAPPHPGDDEAAEQRYLNDGVFEVRRLKFNIGYLNLSAFGRPPAGDKIAAAMRLLKDTAALIVDLRDCHGGDTDTVTLAESYFFPAKTHLLDMYTRADHKTEAVYAAESLPEPRYGSDKPMFVLINGETISGCEAFAYAMQSHKRATIVGAASAGAAFFGEPRRLTDHLMAFIPLGRPIDPITHGDWEGHGVAPTEVVEAGSALEVAERLSLEAIEPREHSPRRRTSMQKRIGELRATTTRR